MKDNVVTLYIYLPYEYFEKDIENNYLKLTMADYTNDPCEFLVAPCNLEKMKDVIEMQNKAARTKWGCLCFSKNGKNSAMWGNYADKHYGVCLEFEFEYFDKFNPKRESNVYSYIVDKIKNAHFDKNHPDQSFVREIAYSGVRSHYPDTDEEMVNEFDRFKKDLINSKREQLEDKEVINFWINDIWQDSIYTKNESWKYEEEVRMMFFLGGADLDNIIGYDPEKCDCGNIFVKGVNKYIKRVVLGVRCESNEEDVRKFLESNNRCDVSVVRAKYDDRCHEIKF